jgi:hypothetical protein
MARQLIQTRILAPPMLWFRMTYRHRLSSMLCRFFEDIVIEYAL